MAKPTNTLNLPIKTTPAGQVKCLGLTFESDEARRAHFTELLRTKLKDPEFRKTPGFPKGTDEDILAMSDPPYYTACPNPFLADFVSLNGKPHVPGQAYHRDPLATDVKENKHHPIYLAHTYHTKVPHRAIMRYILHYTSPGDLVLDAFSGTGMTGVAALLCGDRAEVEALGYSVRADGGVFNAEGKRISELGARKVILNDLSPMATFIGHNHVRGGDGGRSGELEGIFDQLDKDLGWMYATLHNPSASQLASAIDSLRAGSFPDSSSSTIGTVNFSIWSEVFLCSHCGNEVVFWDAAVDRERGAVRDEFPCRHCRSTLTKREIEPALRSAYDPATKTVHRQVKTVPVMITYTYGRKRFEKVPDAFDLQLCEHIAALEPANWFPTDRLPDGIETRRNDDAGLTHYHHFYTPRNLRTLAAAWDKLPKELRWIVTGCLHRASRQHQVAITRVGGEKAGDGGMTAGHRRGTLYVPSNQVEMNVTALLRDRAKVVVGAMTAVRSGTGALSSTQSASSLQLPPESVDYFFFDPPFGANISYSELNSTSEAWHRVFTNNELEAIEDRAQNKDTDAYRHLIAACFANVYRALKPGRWLTVEFSNTQAAVWNALQTALQEAGFVVANVSALSKGRGGLMSIVGVTAMKQDLILSAYKPSAALSMRLELTAGSPEDAWAFVREHLQQVPVVCQREGALETIFGRTAQALYDRMLAFFVQRGAAVPLSGPEFYAGLEQRFARRDTMFFLSDQVAEYDRLRAAGAGVRQLPLFVSDEASAIRWVRQFLEAEPMTFQEINPRYMAAASGWARHERTVELRDILAENFLKYDGVGEVPEPIRKARYAQSRGARSLDESALRQSAKEVWYVPALHSQGDLERVRQRALLKEFEEYKQSAQRKLKLFRAEAVRAGFKAAYDARDWRTIVEVAAKLPEIVVQEDEKLAMYVDVAQTRYESADMPSLF